MSHSTAIAVKFLVSLQSGHRTGHQQVSTSGRFSSILCNRTLVFWKHNLGFSFGAGFNKDIQAKFLRCLSSSNHFVILTPDRKLIKLNWRTLNLAFLVLE